MAITPDAFRDLLRLAGLSQKQFARLGGTSQTSVNRWCSNTAADRVPAPRYIVAVAVAYVLLPPKDRVLMLKKVAQLNGEVP